VSEEFRFDEASHAYWLGDRRLPSVTQVIAPLSDWSSVPPALLERKRALGTAVHLACELDDAGDLDDAETHPEVLGYVNGWRRFMSATGAKVVMSERRAFHRRLGFAGTLDRVLLIEGQGVLVDLKTAAAPSPSWGVQLAGYQLLLEDEGEIAINMRYAVRLLPDGDFRVDRFTNPNDELCFRALLSVHQWKETNQ
jgi:hypothetical protein